MREHERRCHRATWALVALNTVCDRANSVACQHREIGQLVIQQKAVGHPERAHAALDGRRHHDHVAHFIDNRDVGRALAFSVADTQLGAGENASNGGAHALVEIDQVSAVTQVGLAQHRVSGATGQRHKIGVCDVDIAV